MTSKFYGIKVLCYLRTARLEAQLKGYHHLHPVDEQTLFEGIVLLAQWVQMYEEIMPSLSHIQGIIDGTVESVTQLVRTRASATPSQIVSFINQVLEDEMGFCDSQKFAKNCHMDKVYFY